MVQFHNSIVVLHIAIGTVALLLFWVPAFARKGGRLHIQAGKIYVICMYVVSVSAFVASIMVLVDPISIRAPDGLPESANIEAMASRFRMFSLFLLMLSLLVFASLRHGISALRLRQQPERLRHPAHRASIALLGACAVAVGYFGIAEGQLLLMIFSAIGGLGAIGMFRDTLKTAPNRSDRTVMHLNSLIGTGIGAYTAFFAFGGSRFLSHILQGQWQVVPWVLPAIFGTIAINRLRRRYPGSGSVKTGSTRLPAAQVPAHQVEDSA